jgi:hypothetical protein
VDGPPDIFSKKICQAFEEKYKPENPPDRLKIAAKMHKKHEKAQ